MFLNSFLERRCGDSQSAALSGWNYYTAETEICNGGDGEILINDAIGGGEWDISGRCSGRKKKLEDVEKELMKENTKKSKKMVDNRKILW